MNIKKLITFFILLFSISLFAQGNHLIKANELKADEYTLIDVRTSEEFDEGTIYSARNIDIDADDFTKKIQLLDKNSALIIFCKSGGRSQKAYQILKEEGFTNVKEIEGGYDAWIEFKEGK